tara:strand:+ start:178 stop:339 length:162 start_codon:yes stop_codon:yes gene_type:complete
MKKQPKKKLKESTESRIKARAQKKKNRQDVRDLKKDPDEYYDWYDESFEKFRR